MSPVTSDLGLQNSGINFAARVEFGKREEWQVTEGWGKG